MKAIEGTLDSRQRAASQAGGKPEAQAVVPEIGTTLTRSGSPAGNSDGPRKLITIDELSALWSIPKATLYNWVNQKRLPYVKLGRSLRFDVLEIDELRRRSTISEAGKR